MHVYKQSLGNYTDVVLRAGGEKIEFFTEADNRMFLAWLDKDEKINFKCEHEGLIFRDTYDIKGAPDYEVPIVFNRFVNFINNSKTKLN
jgi:hypothetical protein